MRRFSKFVSLLGLNIPLLLSPYSSLSFRCLLVTFPPCTLEKGVVNVLYDLVT